MKHLLGAACAAMAGLCGPAAAQAWYGSIELAPAHLGRAPAGLAIDERQTGTLGAALALGYRAGGDWSFELGWRDIGRARWRGTPPWCEVPPGMACAAVVPQPVVRRLHSTAWVASAVWQRPVAEGWSWRARLGLAALRERERWAQVSAGMIDIPADGSPPTTIEPGTERPTSDRRSTRAALWMGAGLQRALTPRVMLNAELQAATGPRANRPLLASLGLAIGF